MKKLTLVLCFCAMLVLVALPVRADSITEEWTGYFTSDHMTDGAGTPPFGYVTLTQNDTSVDFYVDLYDGSKFVTTGAGGGYNFVFNGTDVALGDISGSGLTIGSGPIHANGTGYWDFGVFFTGQANGGSGALVGPIEFTVANALIVDLLVGNGEHIFAADIISGQTGNTGMVDVDSEGVPNVPEPSTILLLGLGLVGMAAVRKFKK